MELHSISPLSQPANDTDIHALASLLVDVVDAGDVVSFLAPLQMHDALAWWEKTLGTLDARSCVLVARDRRGEIVGTVQCHSSWAPNQAHRGEIAKLMVHPRARGNGVGRGLMEAVERDAAHNGFGMLTLDTKAGCIAETLYRSLGWAHVGTIPRFACDPDGMSMHDAAIYCKELGQNDRVCQTKSP